MQKDLKDANNRFEQAEREAAARQEQVQREVENQLKERDSRIQVCTFRYLRIVLKIEFVVVLQLI